jgi:hypothetical protein
MAIWDELKPILARLRDQQPGTLMQYLILEVDEGRQPPFTIHLAPWAAVAEEMHRRFRDAVGPDGRSSSFPYPPGRRPQHPPATGQPPDLLGQQEIVAGLFGPDHAQTGRPRLDRQVPESSLTGTENT